MKIGLFVRSIRGRGVEKSFLELAYGFQKVGHDVRLILEKDEIQLPVKGLLIDTLQAESKSAKAREIYELYQQYQFDLVIASNAELCRRIKRFDNVYFVVSMSYGARLPTSFFSRQRKKRKLQRRFKHCQLIAVSEGVKQDLLVTLGVKPRSIRVIFDPYPIERIQLQAKKPLDYQQQRPYIIAVGSLQPIKNYHFLIQAYQQVLNTVDIDLVIVGDGPLKQELTTFIQVLGLEQRIHLVGWQDNPYNWIQRAELVALSSVSEGMPRVLIEGLILKKKLVSTDCAYGPSEILTGALKPFLVPPGNLEAYVQAIVRALQTEIRLTEKDYNRFSQHGIIHIYEQLMAKKRTTS